MANPKLSVLRSENRQFILVDLQPTGSFRRTVDRSWALKEHHDGARQAGEPFPDFPHQVSRIR
jgi:hypothetical protein